MPCVNPLVALASLVAVASAFTLGMIAEAKNRADRYRWDR